MECSLKQLDFVADGEIERFGRRGVFFNGVLPVALIGVGLCRQY